MPSFNRPELGRTWTQHPTTSTCMWLPRHSPSSVFFRIDYLSFAHRLWLSLVCDSSVVTAKPNLRERESSHPARNILKRGDSTLSPPGRARCREMHSPAMTDTHSASAAGHEMMSVCESLNEPHVQGRTVLWRHPVPKWHCGKVVMTPIASLSHREVPGRVSCRYRLSPSLCSNVDGLRWTWFT